MLLKDNLESKLQSSNARIKLIATDGVFSMDANITPLPEICDLADKYQALVFVDESHATGFFGKTGRGTEEFFGLNNRVDIINSTLGKALGGAAGGYTTGPKELINLLRQRSRPYIFSSSVPPPVVGCANKAFDLLMGSAGYAEKIQANTERFRTQMTSAGFIISGDNHPICPIMIGDARLATDMIHEMFDEVLRKVREELNSYLFTDRGIYVFAVSYPVVPKGKARIRVVISTSHTFDEIDETVEAFKQTGKKFKFID
ncbi:2-amino-3-ketobutyrate coenzyme A ligase, mitochondrial [Armadillidium vulgare]|nr:2-amino-3-ketobutyrate coenzyme A ligase, mitochondrial [Armadillidium vulgare]